MAEALIRFHGIGAQILQRIGTDLFDQAYSPAFLAQIKQYPTALCGDPLQRQVKLGTAVAAQAAQCVTSEAFRMQTAKHGISAANRPKCERDMLFAGAPVAKAVQGEFGPPCR
jgi:hypothetical protein